ncbi:hypothetical protein VSR01_19375 [Actinacidiphila sp. DG2A-62]|uniref:hypothetical protein n=1 Tax=Actinacidiphila sp. DG2A-62 TaxID=3108821 RepID=UPI002DB7DF0A|nr:hypothetical protein [Actinacidiphila sp. DG2A-62]MEC3995571.1 hypothetical protein [Actinacidiphila sp. DG2A-62]
MVSLRSDSPARSRDHTPAIEAAHNLNAASRAVDRHATGRTPGTLADGRERNRAVLIDAFHEAARGDVGVSGEAHPGRDLLLPEARRDGEWTVPTISGHGGRAGARGARTKGLA